MENKLENRFVICEWLIDPVSLERTNYEKKVVFANNSIDAIKLSEIHPDFIAWLKDSKGNYYHVEKGRQGLIIFSPIFHSFKNRKK